MMERDNAVRAAGQSSVRSNAVDLLIIGGGIMGLWAAIFARRAGLTVHLLDNRLIGSGASGGLLGALMPHMPDKWSDKKQFQFDALVSLEAEIGRLEAQAGLSAGYRRTGRLIPLPKPHLAEIALRHQEDALIRWKAGERQFHWNVHGSDYAASLVSPEMSGSGFVEDTLAARVNPRDLTLVIRKVLESDKGVRITEGVDLERLDAGTGLATVSSGSIAFHHAIVAAGIGSNELLSSLSGPFQKPVVVPVKGQAALLKADMDPDMPVIYRDGLYVVPHERGLVAIGSTSELYFNEPFTTDSQLEDLLASATALVPLLRDAPVLERWAGLRPKAIGREPMVGALPGFDRVSVLTGGFKVSFGVAHHLSSALIDQILQIPAKISLPVEFEPMLHLEKAAATRT